MGEPLRCVLCQVGSITPHVHVHGVTSDGRPTLTSVRRAPSPAARQEVPDATA